MRAFYNQSEFKINLDWDSLAKNGSNKCHLERNIDNKKIQFKASLSYYYSQIKIIFNYVILLNMVTAKLDNHLN